MIAHILMRRNEKIGIVPILVLLKESIRNLHQRIVADITVEIQ